MTVTAPMIDGVIASPEAVKAIGENHGVRKQRPTQRAISTVGEGQRPTQRKPEEKVNPADRKFLEINDAVGGAAEVVTRSSASDTVQAVLDGIKNRPRTSPTQGPSTPTPVVDVREAARELMKLLLDSLHGLNDTVDGVVKEQPIYREGDPKPEREQPIYRGDGSEIVKVPLNIR